MATEDRIQCPSCCRAVVPQLWVDTRNKLSHPRVMHLCPLCGAVLRESGGRMNRRMLAFVIGSFCLCILLFVLLYLESRF
jgi:ribosomal protein S27E